MANSGHDADRLLTQVQDLPPELFHMILDFTFTTPASIRYIDEDYQPTPLLSIDQHYRHKVAQAYYGESSVFWCKNWRVCSSWLLALPPEHLALVGEIRCDFEDIGPQIGELARELNLLRALIGFCELGDRLEDRGLFFGPDSVFKMCHRGVKVRQYPTFKANGRISITQSIRRSSHLNDDNDGNNSNNNNNNNNNINNNNKQ